MSTLCTERTDDHHAVVPQVVDTIETGDVLEISVNGETISALVLLATDDAVILDACDDSTPFVVRRSDLVDYRRFTPELV